ncbi:MULTISPECIES: ribbon-helix-helix domain-containing protein [Aeromonas]|uniref:hypothetical protein n=1 Tax=Aeromonas veronii TaxID=654 RepID=UPI0018F24CF7|nr:hypothetical protein [Aeromonas veronii]MBJ7590554.1 hypothetical protein [Aeromonas veronii]
MDLNRIFNFLYFGFVGDDVGRRRSGDTNTEVLINLIKEHGVTIHRGVSVNCDEYRALMSVDLIYRYSNNSKIDEDQSKRWQVKYCFLRNVAMNRETLSAHEIKNIQYDFEQLNVFLEYYNKSGEDDETISEVTTLLNDFEKCTEDNPNKRAAIFLKSCVSLMDVELNKKSISLCNVLKIGDRYVMEHSHYIITAIAVKLMSEFSKTKPTGEYGVRFLDGDLFSFYVEIIRKDIFSRRTDELINRLQAFIDMFIIGICYNKKQQDARRKYIFDIIRSVPRECICLQVESVKNSVRQFVEKYGHSFFYYMSKNRFNRYSNNKWYHELYHLAGKDKEYFGFITTVMSFLPRERHDVKRIMLLSKKALEKKEREKVNGKRTQLNVTVDSETMDNLEKLEKKLGKNKFEVVIEAVKLLHRFHIRKSRSPSQGLGIKPDQMGSNQTDDKRHLRQNRSLRNSAWNEKASRSTNEIQDAPHPSILLDSVSENGVSTVPPEVPQSYQPPTSAELPASEEVDEAASPRPTALQTLGDNLG